MPTFILISTLIPIIQDNLGDTASSENYRAISIGNLILKWFDYLILIMKYDKLNMDELQFGFQKGTGTNMCSWAITSVIDYYNRAGRPVFACSMDLSKAFDVVSCIQLFKELDIKIKMSTWRSFHICICRRHYIACSKNGKFMGTIQLQTYVRRNLVLTL